MSRISSEKANQMIGSQYEMILIAVARERELRAGAEPMIETNLGPQLTALKEIELGLIDRSYLSKILK